MSTAHEETVRWATRGLAAAVGLAIVAIVVLASIERLRPEVLAALAGVAGTATGALATMLTTFAPAAVPGGRRSTDPPPLDPLREDRII